MHSGLFLQANIIHLLLQQATGSVQEINAEFQAKQIKKVVQGNLHPISAQEARYAKVKLGGRVIWVFRVCLVATLNLLRGEKDAACLVETYCLIEKGEPWRPRESR